MARKRGLGRGLGALISQDIPAEETAVSAEKQEQPPKKAVSKKKTTTAETVLRSIQKLPITMVEPNPDQPRKTFDPEALEDMTESVRRYGILQPIVVEKYTVPGHAPYRIIAGERRYRAAKKAGLSEVPVVLREEHLEEQALLSVVENVQRQDLTPVEEAVAYQNIMEQRKMTQQELADALGKSRPYVANAIRLLKLDEETLEALKDGRLTSSQGRTLLAEKDLKKRAAYRKLLVEGRSSVQDVEHRRRQPKRPNVFTEDLERRLSETLGTKVSVISRRRGWSVQVSCYNEEDLNRLLERLLLPEQR